MDATAYVDESARVPGEGLYLVASVVVFVDRASEIRERLRRLLLPRQLRFHWREESPKRRLEMLKLIQELRVEARAYVRNPTGRREQGRARRLCLEELLWDLRQLGIGELVIESRGEDLDRQDRQAIIEARRALIAPDGLKYGFARPKEEPLLWIPDSIAGAVAACEVDPGCEYGEALAALAVRRRGVRR